MHQSVEPSAQQDVCAVQQGIDRPCASHWLHDCFIWPPEAHRHEGISTGATTIKIGVKLGRISIIRDQICSQKLQHASSHAATGRCVAFACAQLIMSVMAASGVSKRLRKSLDMLALDAGSMCELALAQAVIASLASDFCCSRTPSTQQRIERSLSAFPSLAILTQLKELEPKWLRKCAYVMLCCAMQCYAAACLLACLLLVGQRLLEGTTQQVVGA